MIRLLYLTNNYKIHFHKRIQKNCNVISEYDLGHNLCYGSNRDVCIFFSITHLVREMFHLKQNDYLSQNLVAQTVYGPTLLFWGPMPKKKVLLAVYETFSSI